MSEKPKFILCPRCELNYIEESEGFCKVCKASMGLIDASILIPDDDEMAGEKICPICRVNYIGEDEDMCFECKKEREQKDQPEENDDDWREFVDDKLPDESDEISLSELEEEEEAEEDEFEDEENSYEDDFDYDLSDSDEEYDEDEEEDEDEE